ncbi:hypothetical protein D3C87_77570 [compost metagenome]
MAKTQNFGLNLSIDRNFDYLDYRYKELFDENWQIIDTQVYTPSATSVLIEDEHGYFTATNVEEALAETITELRNHKGSGGSAHPLVTPTSAGFMDPEDKKKLDTIAEGGINQTTADARYVRLIGGVMTGPLVLTGDPTQSLEAATKQFVDGVRTAADAKFLQLAGGTMNGHIILTNTDPTQDRHAASKKYVDAVKTYADTIKTYTDSVKQSLDIKDSVKLATTANINLGANATKLTIDGVQTQTNDRVLVKNQTTASENGIYTVQADGSFVRSIDADTNAKMNSGMFTFVEQGTANSDSGWVLSTDGTITIGSTALNFTQFSGAGQIVAGSGLVKSGSTLSLDTTGVGAGTYRSVQVDTFGRVLSGSNPNLPATNVSFSSANFTSTNVSTALDELFLNVSNGKNLIASAITGKNVSASGSDSFSTLSTKIGQISTGVGDAVVGDVLAGKTFTNLSSNNLTGTMVNRGAVVLTPGTAAVAIPVGYHNGSGTVSGDADLTSANIKSGVNIFGVAGTYTNEAGGTAAIAGDLLSGKAAHVNGARIVGSMQNNGAVSLTPGVAVVTIPAGYHNGSGTVAGEANLLAPNIKNGVSIFGVTGTMPIGKQFTTGTVSIKDSVAVSFTGLSFVPTLFMAFQSGVDANSTGMIINAPKAGITTTTGSTITSKITWNKPTPSPQDMVDLPVVTWTSNGLSFTPSAGNSLNTPVTYFIFE